MGGLCLGFEKNGFVTSWANDTDKDVEKTYRHNFSNTQYFGIDIRDLDPADLSAVDVVHGGFPCQSFSGAGSRSGFDDPKGRGQLFDIMIDKISQLEKLPWFLVFENVPYLKIGANGRWFEHIKQKIKSLGYWFSDTNALIVDARKHAGLPQRRERLFMVAANKSIFDYNPFNFVKEANEVQSLSNLLMKYENIEPPKSLSKDSKYHNEMWEKGIKDGELKEPYQLVQYRKTWPRIIEPGFCPTVTQNMGAGGHNVPFYWQPKQETFRKLSVAQCLALQGFPNEIEFPVDISVGERYRMIGNSVSPLVSDLIAQQIKHFVEERKNELKLAV